MIELDISVCALAGGPTGTAKLEDGVIVRKNPDTGQEQEAPVNLKKIMARKSNDVRLYPNDILFIPDNRGKKALLRAAEAALSITTGVAILRGAR